MLSVMDKINYKMSLENLREGGERYDLLMDREFLRKYNLKIR